jgi:hypothetical protein
MAQVDILTQGLTSGIYTQDLTLSGEGVRATQVGPDT